MSVSRGDGDDHREDFNARARVSKGVTRLRPSVQFTSVTDIFLASFSELLKRL